VLIFLLRFLFNLTKLLVICLPLELIGLILVPIALLIPTYSYRLPTYLRWFDSADWYTGRDTEIIETISVEGFWTRYYWLAIRNPLNYFGYKVLGHKVIDNTKGIQSGTPNIGDTIGHVSGYQYNTLDNIYEYYLIYKWNRSKCLRFRMGWKISNGPDNKINSYIQWVMVIQPYKDYTGE